MISTIQEKYIEALTCAETGETICVKERKKSRRRNTVPLNPSELPTCENPEHNKNIDQKTAAMLYVLAPTLEISELCLHPQALRSHGWVGKRKKIKSLFSMPAAEHIM